LQQRIYTRQGDRGVTSLGDGGFVPKSSAAVRALGALDEAAAWLGFLAAHPEPLPAVTCEQLRRAQEKLSMICALVASPSRVPHRVVKREDVGELEAEIDSWEGELPPLLEFVLPGGTHEAAVLHLARTVVRRVECETVAFAETEAGSAAKASLEPALAYLNRLSDWLFVAARVANLRADVGDARGGPHLGPAHGA